MQRRKQRRGELLVEFTLCSIPLIFICISVFWMAVDMWEYHTLVAAVNEAARYASVHGSDCAGKTCAIRVEDVANVLANRAVGLPPGRINATLTSSAQNYTCNPLTSCQTNASAWPSLAANTPATAGAGTDISISATFTVGEPKDIWVPGAGTVKFNGWTLGANSTQPVVY